MNYIVSYPRSGNTLTRYLIELVTRKPTNGICGEPNPKDTLQKPLIHSGANYAAHKRHDFHGITAADFVLFIIRDPFDATIRHNEAKRGLSEEKMRGHLDGWFDLLNQYEKHIQAGGNGMVWYYEELLNVADPRAKEIYRKAESTGPGFHKAKLPVIELTRLEAYIKAKYSYLVKKYLAHYL